MEKIQYTVLIVVTFFEEKIDTIITITISTSSDTSDINTNCMSSTIIKETRAWISILRLDSKWAVVDTFVKIRCLGPTIDETYNTTYCCRLMSFTCCIKCNGAKVFAVIECRAFCIGNNTTQNNISCNIRCRFISH